MSNATKPPETELESVLRRLREPFAAHELRWRKANDSGPKLIYIDARCVIDRLNEVLPGKWSDGYRTITMPMRIPVDDKGKQVGARHATTHIEKMVGGMICTLKLNLPEVGWVSFEGCAQGTDIEDIKGAESDSLKRAAVKIGIGRYLYDLTGVQELGSVPPWAQPGGSGMRPEAERAYAAKLARELEEEEERQPAQSAPAVAPPPAAPPVAPPPYEERPVVLPTPPPAEPPVAPPAVPTPNDTRWMANVSPPQGLETASLYNNIRSGPEVATVTLAGVPAPVHVRVKGRPLVSAVNDKALRAYMHLAAHDMASSSQARDAWKRAITFINDIRAYGIANGHLLE